MSANNRQHQDFDSKIVVNKDDETTTLLQGDEYPLKKRKVITPKLHQKHMELDDVITCVMFFHSVEKATLKDYINTRKKM